MSLAATVMTIGHSNHDLSRFLELLSDHGVSVVIDVRSQPYSRFAQFNQENLAGSLGGFGINYMFLGRELGARRDEPECYENDQATYDHVAELPAFREGLSKVLNEAESNVVALMCAEREPLDCHRAVLIARHLEAHGVEVRHILADGAIEAHKETEKRMVLAMGVDPLFDAGRSPSELIARAYAERGKQIAYRRQESESE
ncbi:DUF488 domain-containing protein [Aeoliella sp. ICT_H6.2]|uniref:DUF488 domain-containing protein n=1 Tax=Aeoliella straminimaris TaxID=2954799 RepID=A0A9X2JHW6_9BACT|nr:DUF488 domain-containing protein [Aeoliella straminimaris]MCO6043334.1 DUF488 domain-containing protein [Aeoliella straminimaris]